MKIFYVYELRDESGRPFYVGKGSGYRISQHQTRARAGHSSHCACKIRAILARGGSVHAVKVLETPDEGAAFAEEIRLIAHYGRANLTNKTDGGDGVRNMTPEARERIAASRRGVVASEETREKQRAAKLGRPRTDSTKAKISAYQKGSRHPWARSAALANLETINATPRTGPLTAEHRAAISAGKMGHTVSAETRAKISAAKMGSIPWNKGKRTRAA